HYKALPVVPKIYYKQNRNDNAKGADSVHIVIADDGADFSLWLGESKFYSDIGDARLDKVVQSVLEMLNSEKIRKENSIIMGLTDLGDLIG
ncbi:HamA C-terminal domain-containing protein, partial [Staphylococcus aureus]